MELFLLYSLEWFFVLLSKNTSIKAVFVFQTVAEPKPSPVENIKTECLMHHRLTIHGPVENGSETASPYCPDYAMR